MKVPEDFKSSRSSWIECCGRPPTDAYELFVELHCAVTPTLVNCDLVDAVRMDDAECYIGSQQSGAWLSRCMS
jgi:hypothetical protein